MINSAVLMGRMVADPELKATQSGVSVCSFRIAVDRDYTPKGEERKADFIDIVAWKHTAEFVSRYFRKGSMIAVVGSIQSRNWEDKNGNKRSSVEVVADHVSFCGREEKKTESANETPTLSVGTDDMDDGDFPWN